MLSQREHLDPIPLHFSSLHFYYNTTFPNTDQQLNFYSRRVIASATPHPACGIR